MKTLLCPNSKCNTVFEANGFRPVDFTCLRCGLQCYWYSLGRYSRGYIRWDVTDEAIDFVKAMTEGIKIPVPVGTGEVKEIEILEVAADAIAVSQLYSDVALHQRDLPLY